MPETKSILTVMHDHKFEMQLELTETMFYGLMKQKLSHLAINTKQV